MPLFTLGQQNPHDSLTIFNRLRVDRSLPKHTIKQLEEEDEWEEGPDENAPRMKVRADRSDFIFMSRLHIHEQRRECGGGSSPTTGGVVGPVDGTIVPAPET